MNNMKFVLSLALMALVLQGCVRVAGGAGYWRTDPEKGTQTKSVGFDTSDLVQNGQTPGSITQ